MVRMDGDRGKGEVSCQAVLNHREGYVAVLKVFLRGGVGEAVGKVGALPSAEHVADLSDGSEAGEGVRG